jgi:hypothetical protein
MAARLSSSTERFINEDFGRGFNLPEDPGITIGADSDDVDQSFRSHADQIGAKRRRALLV